MSRHPVPRSTLGAALVVGLASTVHAGPSAEDETRRLDDTAFFVERLDKGWEPLLSDLDRSIDTLKAEPADRTLKIRQIADREREAVALKRLKDGEPGEARALQLFEKLAESAVDTGRRPEFHERCANVLMDQADRAEQREKDDGKALNIAKRALAHVRPFPRASQMIARLGFKVAKAAEADEKYDEAIDFYDSTMKELRGAGATDASKEIVDGKSAIDRIRATTGTPSVAWLGDPQGLLAIPGAKTDFTHATLTFSGPGGKAPPTQTIGAGPLRRMRTGNWQVTATGAGGSATFSANLSLSANGGEITMLPVQPEGMVLVRETAGADAFLIDETEWTNAQYAAVAGGPSRGPANVPVAGISFDEARNAAARANKRIPTYEQWQRAAFQNPSDRGVKYPWGGATADPAVHFVGGMSDADTPQPSRTRPAGRSWSGCFDMAGNCWEWIDYRGRGWLIGGGWKWSVLERDFQTASGDSLVFDFLRDPLPTEETYDNYFPDKADQNRYLRYKASAASTLPQVGMRCVVPLGRPRR